MFSLRLKSRSPLSALSQSKQINNYAPEKILKLISSGRNAIMSSRNQRINNGISSLVRRLQVDIPGEDDDAAEERENEGIDFVTSVLER